MVLSMEVKYISNLTEYARMHGGNMVGDEEVPVSDPEKGASENTTGKEGEALTMVKMHRRGSFGIGKDEQKQVG